MNYIDMTLTILRKKYRIDWLLPSLTAKTADKVMPQSEKGREIHIAESLDTVGGTVFCSRLSHHH